VDAVIAVHLDVDQSRDRDQLVRAGTQAHGEHAPIDDLDVAGDELASDERGLDPQPHREGSPRIGPPAPGPDRLSAPARAALTTSHAWAAAGVARCVMCRHAS